MAIPFDPRNRQRYAAPPPPRRRRTSSMSAGQVLIVGFVCFLAASLLNAESLHDWAARQAFDSRVRRPALTATDGLVWIAEHTGLAKPREAVDDALGREAEGGSGVGESAPAGS